MYKEYETTNVVNDLCNKNCQNPVYLRSRYWNRPFYDHIFSTSRNRHFQFIFKSIPNQTPYGIFKSSNRFEKFQSVHDFRSLPKIWYNLLFYHNSITVENFLKRFADLKIPQLDMPRPIEKRILESQQSVAYPGFFGPLGIFRVVATPTPLT